MSQRPSRCRPERSPPKCSACASIKCCIRADGDERRADGAVRRRCLLRCSPATRSPRHPSPPWSPWRCRSFIHLALEPPFWANGDPGAETSANDEAHTCTFGAALSRLIDAVERHCQPGSDVENYGVWEALFRLADDEDHHLHHDFAKLDLSDVRPSEPHASSRDTSIARACPRRAWSVAARPTSPSSTCASSTASGARPGRARTESLPASSRTSPCREASRSGCDLRAAT
jgi:hypothetical protein